MLSSPHLIRKFFRDILVVLEVAIVASHHLIIDLRVVVETCHDDVPNAPELVCPLMSAPTEEADALGICMHQPPDKFGYGRFAFHLVMDDQPFLVRLGVNQVSDLLRQLRAVIRPSYFP